MVPLFFCCDCCYYWCCCFLSLLALSNLLFGVLSSHGHKMATVELGVIFSQNKEKVEKSPNGHFPNAYLSFFREIYNFHMHDSNLPLITHWPKHIDRTIHKIIIGKEGYDNDCFRLTGIYPLKLNSSLLKNTIKIFEQRRTTK